MPSWSADILSASIPRAAAFQAAFLALLFVSLCPLPAHCALPAEIGVTLLQAHPPTSTLLLDGPFEVVSPRRLRAAAVRYQVRKKGDALTLHALLPSGKLQAGPPLIAGSSIRLTARDGRVLGIEYPGRMHRRYRGKFILSCAKDGIGVINELPVRDYVNSVVGSETLSGFSSEALKAQAVLTQTRLTHYRKGDALSDTTEREAYLGADYERPEVKESVNPVWGLILTNNGVPIVPFYHSTCAGGTSNGELLFKLPPGKFPYLGGRVCRYCKKSPFWKTTTNNLPSAQVAAKLGSADIEILQRDVNRRPIQVQVGAIKSNGYDLWMKIGQNFGWDKVPGTRYSVEQRAGAVILSSTGAGHGVGLCQWGANGLAKEGKTYENILKYYFPGTSIKRTK